MRAFFAFAILMSLAAEASAAETITYTYDARGRLIKVERTGTVNNGVTTTYTIDKADNRTLKTVAGATPPGPSVSIESASAAEGDDLIFTVTRAGATTDPITVDFASADGTATAGSDYASAGGALSFAAGEATKAITISSTDDSLTEGSETFTVTLSNASAGTTIGTAQGVGTITDNDAPTLSISNAIGVEGNILVFTVTKTGSLSAFVEYGTVDDTAVASSDYVSQVSNPLKSLTFGPTETTKFISVPTTSDTVPESTERFGVALVNPTGATLSDHLGLGFITDDD